MILEFVYAVAFFVLVVFLSIVATLVYNQIEDEEEPVVKCPRCGKKMIYFKYKWVCPHCGYVLK